MSDILSMLEPVDEWVNRSPIGREAEPSPYLPAVQKSWSERGEADKDGIQLGKAYSFSVTLNGKSPEDQDKDLKRHVNYLHKAGKQVDGGPVSVQVQQGDINRKSGAVKLTFRTRTKITRPGAGNAAQGTEATAA